jgi:hypothetical protein
LQIRNQPNQKEKENTLKSQNTINQILDSLDAQQQSGETSLIVRIEPGLIPDAMNALRSYRTLFAPVIAGLTDTAPIYENYERLRQANETKPAVLLLVECQTIEQFRKALDPLGIRNSSEWRSSFNDAEWSAFFDDKIG